VSNLQDGELQRLGFYLRLGDTSVTVAAVAPSLGDGLGFRGKSVLEAAAGAVRLVR
jgi:hypothetical protein